MSALSHETVVQNQKKMAAKAQKLFHLLDINDDKSLDLEEFTKFVKAIVGDDTHENIANVAGSILAITDSNQDGKVDLGEWNTMILAWDHPRKEEILDMFIDEAPAAKKNPALSDFKMKKLMELFHKLDTNNNGTLEFNEVEALNDSINLNLASSLFKTLDKNRDEKISVGEWLRGMKPYEAIPDHVFGPRFDEYLRLVDEHQQRKVAAAAPPPPKPKLPMPSQEETRALITEFLETTDTQYRYMMQPLRPNSFVVTFSKPSKHFPVPQYQIETVFVVDPNENGLEYYVEDEEQPKIPSQMDVAWSDKWLDKYICKKMMFAKLASTKALLDDPWLKSRVKKQQWKDSEPEAAAARASSV